MTSRASSRPAPRKSGRAPKRDALDSLLQVTLDRLCTVVTLQATKGGYGLKSRHLSRVATDLELAFIERKGKDLTDRLCLDIAATALLILERGDGH